MIDSRRLNDILGYQRSLRKDFPRSQVSIDNPLRDFLEDILRFRHKNHQGMGLCRFYSIDHIIYLVGSPRYIDRLVCNLELKTFF